jgi:hypothetical protein
MLVEIQKGRLISLLQQPIGDPAGGGPITAGVGDEDASHQVRAAGSKDQPIGSS